VKPVESTPTGLIGDLPPEGLPAHIGAVRIAYNDAQYRT